MTHSLFPERIETSRLTFERMSNQTTDPFELYEFVTRGDWQGTATEHMPWFRLQRLDQVANFIDRAEQLWRDRDGVRYLLRRTGGDEHQDEDEQGELIGTTAYKPEWNHRRAGSGIVLAKEYWGRGYGGERAAVFIELTFERYDLDAYYTSCAADNEPSRRMIEKYVDRYGGRYEGLLRQHGSPHPDGTVTDQHRFTIMRSEYEDATRGTETLACEIYW